MTGAVALADLPFEILACIVEYIGEGEDCDDDNDDDDDDDANLGEWRQDVLHLAQTCRHLYQALLPLVYRNLKVDLVVWKEWDEPCLTIPSHLLLSNLLSNGMAGQVHSLRILVHLYEEPREPLGPFNHLWDEEFETAECILTPFQEMNPKEIMVCHGSTEVESDRTFRRACRKFDQMLWPELLRSIGKLRLGSYTGLDWGGVSEPLLHVLVDASQLVNIRCTKSRFKEPDPFLARSLPTLRTLMIESTPTNFPFRAVPNLDKLSIVAEKDSLMRIGRLKWLTSFEVIFETPLVPWTRAEEIQAALLKCLKRLPRLRDLALLTLDDRVLEGSMTSRQGHFSPADLSNLVVGISGHSLLERVSCSTSFFQTPQDLSDFKSSIRILRQKKAIGTFEIDVKSDASGPLQERTKEVCII